MLAVFGALCCLSPFTAPILAFNGYALPGVLWLVLALGLSPTTTWRAIPGARPRHCSAGQARGGPGGPGGLGCCSSVGHHQLGQGPFSSRQADHPPRHAGFPVNGFVVMVACWLQSLPGSCFHQPAPGPVRRPCLQHDASAVMGRCAGALRHCTRFAALIEMEIGCD